MNLNKVVATTFVVSIFSILGSCNKNSTEKSNVSTNPVFYNSFTYTITDTTGTKYSFADTTTYSLGPGGDTAFFVNGHSLSGQVFPAAYISQPNTPNNQNGNLRFIFYDNDNGAGLLNQVTFYLPYYQYNLKRDSLFGNTPLIIILNGSTYDADHQYDTRSLYSINIATNITDSSAGFVSGTFNISALNSTNKSIQVAGGFNHVLTNFMLH
jgi:hypothetical protein